MIAEVDLKAMIAPAGGAVAPAAAPAAAPVEEPAAPEEEAAP
jgi:hypothetical protein